MGRKQKRKESLRAYKNISAAWGKGHKRSTRFGFLALVLAIAGLLIGSKHFMSLFINIVAIGIAIWDMRKPMVREVLDIVAIVFASISIVTVSLKIYGIAEFVLSTTPASGGFWRHISMAELLIFCVSTVMCIIVLINPKFAIIHQIREDRGRAFLTWFLIGLAAYTLYIIVNSMCLI